MLSIRNVIGCASAVGILGVVAAAGFAAPASAAQATAVNSRMAAVASAVTGPNTDIKGKPAHWVPNKLTGPPVTGTCSATNYTFSITNKEKVAEVIYQKEGTTKSKLGSVPAGEEVAICGSGSKGAKAEFVFGKSKSILTVTLS